jgi:hypothetical protein
LKYGELIRLLTLVSTAGPQEREEKKEEGHKPLISSPSLIALKYGEHVMHSPSSHFFPTIWSTGEGGEKGGRAQAPDLVPFIDYSEVWRARHALAILTLFFYHLVRRRGRWKRRKGTSP